MFHMRLCVLTALGERHGYDRVSHHWSGISCQPSLHLLQLKWRKDEQAARADDKAEQKRKDDERETGQRLKEQAAPLFFNFDGTPGPILVTGSQNSSQGPFMYAWCLVTVVNRTQLPMKITSLLASNGG